MRIAGVDAAVDVLPTTGTIVAELVMVVRRRRALLMIAVGAFTGIIVPGPLDAQHGADRIQPNDNRRPSGATRGDTVTLRLEARNAMWYPHGDDGPGVIMPSFAEVGGAARIPGPLLRVRSGTEARVTLTNSLRDTLIVHGLYARNSPPSTDTLPITLAPGEQRSVTFRLEAPGTYYYWGTTMRRAPRLPHARGRAAHGRHRGRRRDVACCHPRDRIFVVGMWTDTVHRSGVHRTRVLAVINGRSWPNTERLDAAGGRHGAVARDQLRRRDLHPMHLHGFYFRVDARGDGHVDLELAPDARRLAVTESMNAGAHDAAHLDSGARRQLALPLSRVPSTSSVALRSDWSPPMRDMAIMPRTE